MHYKNGREAKVGDRVFVDDGYNQYIGVVIKTQPGSTSCNLTVVPMPSANAYSATSSQCLHLEDVGEKSPAVGDAVKAA